MDIGNIRGRLLIIAGKKNKADERYTKKFHG
jgi:hypothetical protein